MDKREQEKYEEKLTLMEIHYLLIYNGFGCRPVQIVDFHLPICNDVLEHGGLEHGERKKETRYGRNEPNKEREKMRQTVACNKRKDNYFVMPHEL